ncbi:outer membrane beta-barrel protein, partial [Acinetobacter baumannii]
FYTQYPIGDSIYHNVSVTTRKNIGKELNSGLNVSLSMPIQNKWNIRLNAFVANRHIVNDLNGGSVTDGIGARTNLNLSYQLQKD